MLASIQAQAHIHTPKKHNPNYMLVSYSNSYKNHILQCAAYGFWTRNKKNAVIINIHEDEESYIQNPKKTKDIGRILQAHITKSPYRISENQRIEPQIQKHLWYIALLTDIQKVSILQIWQNQIFTQEIQDYIKTLTNQDTIIISLANIQEKPDPQEKKDTLAYTLRTKLQEDTNPDILQYKDNQTIKIQNNKDYLHQAA